MPGGKTTKPLDAALYARVTREAKARFEVWPSAYASAWVVKTYKARGGTYGGGGGGASSSSGVARWMREEWVQVEPYLRNGTVRACGAPNTSGAKACRPLHRIAPRTPPTLPELVERHGKAHLLRLARAKRADMEGRVDWRRGTFRASSK